MRRSRVADPFVRLLEKIRHLPPPQQAEVEDFVEFLSRRQLDRELVRAAGALSADSFRSAWDNRDDAAYDRL